MKEGYDGERTRQRERDSLQEKKLEEKQSGALIAKSELKERGMQSS